MRRLIGVFLLAWVAAMGLAEDEIGSHWPRLVNGLLIEGTLQETNEEGLVFLTTKGVVTYPWKYLSPGTRYRHERPFLAMLEADKTNVVKKAAAAARKADTTNIIAQAAATNAPAFPNVPATTNAPAVSNAPATTPDVPAKKKKSRYIP